MARHRLEITPGRVDPSFGDPSVDGGTRVGNGPFISFQPVREPRIGKVRIHIDVLVDDIDPGAERVVALGGADTGLREELPRGRIAVMRDPERNEFCLLAPPTGGRLTR